MMTVDETLGIPKVGFKIHPVGTVSVYKNRCNGGRGIS